MFKRERVPQTDQSKSAVAGIPVEKEKPNFELSGTLAKATNTVNGVVLIYNEPPEARPPTKHWRFYVFKNDAVIGMSQIVSQT